VSRSITSQAKRLWLPVLVDQARQAPGQVVFEVQAQPAMGSLGQAPPQVVGQLDGVLAAFAFAQLDAAELCPWALYA
jgi:hypothetical protein